jgi:hypothetical protein
MQAPHASKEPWLTPQEGLFLVLVIAGWALFVVSLGKDMSWDFRNYHWYAPYAFLNGRMGIDIAVAHHASYYNPLVDVPFFLLATHAPAWLALGTLGAVQGANIVPLYLIARSVLDMAEKRLAAGALSLVCMTGGMTLSLAGTTYYDNIMSVLVLSGLALLVTQRETLAAGPLWRAIAVAAAAGFVTGSAVGLKLPEAPYALGFAAALAILPGTFKQRSVRLLAGGVAGILGVLLFTGFWWVKMDHLTGNPLFPYFNQYFHSPLVADATFRDTRFLPHDLQTALLYPLLFSIDWRVTNDLPFGDVRVGLAYVISIATCIGWAVWRRPERPLVPAAAAGPLFAFAAVSYAGWLGFFAIYRYILSLEMLSPILIVAAIGLWPLKRGVQLSLIGVVLLFAIMETRAGILARAPVDDPYVQVTLPPIPHPDRTMVLMVGEAPMGFIVPSLPPQIPVLRIDGWMIRPDDGSKLTAMAQARVQAHKGDIYLLANSYEMGRASDALTAYDLSIDWTACRDIETNLGGPYRFCPATRGASAK